MHLLLAVLLALPPVLMFHQVDAHAPPGRLGRSLTVAPEQLRDELAYMERHRLRGVSVEDFLRASREGQSTADMVIITFDDGYEDQYRQAVPILLEYGAHATFFITTGNVGKLNHVTWPQVRTMARSGMGIGGHNVHHVDLASLTPDEQRHEIEACLAALRTHAHINAQSYAYPGGTFDRTTEKILASQPIELAFTTDPSHALGADPRFEIARVRVIPSISLDALFDGLTAKHVARLHVPHG